MFLSSLTLGNFQNNVLFISAKTGDWSLDAIDRKIIRAVETDARISYSELAERVSLSKTPCWNRVKALEESGVIRGYVARLDAARLGLSLEAMIHVTIDLALSDAFETAVRNNPLILRCLATTGDADYILHVVATDMPGLDRLLRGDLCRLPGIRRFVTSMITREVKADGSVSAAAESLRL